MAFCPYDGTKMETTNASISFAEHRCPKCNTDWQEDAEEGAFRVINPDLQEENKN